MAQAVENPDVISLAAGLVDYATLPVRDALALAQETFGTEVSGRAALQYGTTQGLQALREAVLARLAALDGRQPGTIDVTPDDVVITTGSQQLLLILSDILMDPGDIAVTAWPSYFVFTGTLEALGAQVRCADMDEDGIVPESLDRVLGGLERDGLLPRVKIVYTVSYHQNPTGITLAAARRGEIADIVRRYSRGHRILLLEDAAYRELTFEGRPPPSMKGHDPENRYVAVLQTFSKTFAPGLKVGYGLLPRDLVEPVILQKGNHDFGSANLCQHLLLAALRTGAYARHVEALCKAYAAKRDAMLEALSAHLGDTAGVRWTHPAGGLYVFLTLPESVETHTRSALFARALEEGVLYVPGEYCYAPDPTRTIPQNTMRLSYGVCGMDDIREGVAALARAVEAVV
jgi:2-aminoadipate transaminase